MRDLVLHKVLMVLLLSSVQLRGGDELTTMTVECATGAREPRNNMVYKSPATPYDHKTILQNTYQILIFIFYLNFYYTRFNYYWQTALILRRTLRVFCVRVHHNNYLFDLI
jgi:hypothetical protein